MDGCSCERTMHFVLEQRVKKPFLARTQWDELFSEEENILNVYLFVFVWIPSRKDVIWSLLIVAYAAF